MAHTGVGIDLCGKRAIHNASSFDVTRALTKYRVLHFRDKRPASRLNILFRCNAAEGVIMKRDVLADRSSQKNGIVGNYSYSKLSD